MVKECNYAMGAGSLDCFVVVVAVVVVVQCQYSGFLRSISRLFGGSFVLGTVCRNVITRVGLLQESTMGLWG